MNDRVRRIKAMLERRQAEIAAIRVGRLVVDIANGKLVLRREENLEFERDQEHE